jgi:glycosyltransferase involved in cell wall biosynthesis
MQRTPFLLSWQIDDTFGWGIAGLNIFREWALGPDVVPLCAMHIPEGLFRESNEKHSQLVEAARRTSNEISRKIAAAGKQQITMKAPVIAAMGNGFQPTFNITGTKNVARIVFEATNIRNKMNSLEKFDAIACISEWNADLLRASGLKNVFVIHEAVDQRLFFPAPKIGLFDPNRFYIFSGGKIEFRKAQDKVLIAFKVFSERHDEAVLMTAWQSNWPQAAAGFKGYLSAPLQRSSRGGLDITRWAVENGISPTAVIDLGLLPNHAVARYMREADCALQISRAEGGTNLFAMEAMASGLATIIAENTGTVDLIRQNNCLAVRHQTPVPDQEDYGTQGWGECDVDEIIDALERLYTDGANRVAMGERASKFIAKWTWSEHARMLANIAV